MNYPAQTPTKLVFKNNIQIREVIQESTVKKTSDKKNNQNLKKVSSQKKKKN